MYQWSRCLPYHLSEVLAEVSVLVFLGRKQLDVEDIGDRIDDFPHDRAAGFREVCAVCLRFSSPKS